MTEYYRGYAAGINRCRKPALMLVDAAGKQTIELETRIEELEAKLKIATQALTKIAKSDTQMWAIDALRMIND